jgi:serine protease inhibitor
MRRHPLLAAAAASALMAALAGSCTGPSTGTEVRSHAERDPANRSMIAPTALANSSLGATLYRTLATRNDNFVFSPYEVSTGLAMAAAGANGTTADQLGVVQHVTPGLDLNDGLNSISQQLAGRSGEQSSEVRRGRITLELPTSLWGQKETRLKEPFLDTLSRYFGTGIRLVDFRSDPEASRRAMNSWVRGQTHNTIEELVPRGTITNVTRLVVTAAASLQAPWDVPFDANRSRPAPFTLLDGQTVSPITMTAQSPDGLLYAKSDGWEAVGMPYLGRQLEMVLIAPDPGRFADVESRLDGAELQRVVTLLKPTPLDLRIPRFGFTTQQNLADPLVDIGASAAFTPGEADFSGITDDEALSISSFPQQTFLSADEDGTTQGTATQVITSKDQPSIKLTPVSIARPFIVMVIDRATGEPIFLGRVLNPTA